MTKEAGVGASLELLKVVFFIRLATVNMVQITTLTKGVLKLPVDCLIHLDIKVMFKCSESSKY